MLPGNMVISDGWKATQAVDWSELGFRYDYCNHSRKSKKGKFQKRTLNRNLSASSTESWTHAKKGAKQGRLIKRLWVNRRGCLAFATWFQVLD